MITSGALSLFGTLPAFFARAGRSLGFETSSLWFSSPGTFLAVLYLRLWTESGPPLLISLSLVSKAVLLQGIHFSSWKR